MLPWLAGKLGFKVRVSKFTFSWAEIWKDGFRKLRMSFLNSRNLFLLFIFVLGYN
jgi:hypothetical protein